MRSILPPEPATEQDRHRSIVTSVSETCFPCRQQQALALCRNKPIFYMRAQPLGAFNAMDTGCQVGTQQTTIGDFITVAVQSRLKQMPDNLRRHLIVLKIGRLASRNDKNWPAAHISINGSLPLTFLIEKALSDWRLNHRTGQ